MKLIPDNLKIEVLRHIEKVRNALKKHEADAILIGSNANIYYSTGRFFRGFVYIPLEGKPIWFVTKPQIWEKEEDIWFIRKPEDIKGILLDLNYSIPGSIALEESDLTYTEIIRLKNIFPDSQLKNGSCVMKLARMVKTDWEISEMKKDGLHHTKVYSEIKKCFKPGMSDLELQIEIEKKLRLEGSLGVSRVSGNLMEINLGSVINGENADNPGPYEFTMGGSGVHPSLPVGANNSPIKEGTTIMIDMLGAFNGYQTDITRVWSFGKVSPLAYKAHECSLKILHALEREAVPGTSVTLLYEIAMNIVEEFGLKDFFMGHKSQVGFIGHGVGIELNELPVLTPKSRDILESSMTIAIEPKFVIPGVGAVGIENTYVVRDHGLENITVFPDNIEEF